MKKLLILSALVASCMMFGMVCSAQDEGVNVVGVAEMISDKENWIEEKQTAKFENGKLIRGTSPEDSVITYVGKEYTNEIFEFNMNFGDMKDGKAWDSIILRSKDKDNKVMWNSSASYAFNVRPNFIELQRYNSGQKQIGFFPCDEIKTDETVTIQCGAVNVNDGVQLIFKINGKTVVNYFDRDQAVTNGGYFAIYNNSTFEMSESDSKELKLEDLPAGYYVDPYNIGDTHLKSQTSFLGDEKTYNFSWYTSDICTNNFLASEEVKDKPIKSFVKKIDGTENKEQYEIKPSDSGKYLLIGVEADNEEVYFSNCRHISTVKYSLSHDVYMVSQYEKAFLNGKFMYIDKDNDFVTPDYVNNELYVPLRFVAESFGFDVAWDDETKTVVLKNSQADKTIKIGDREKYSFEPVILYDRTMMSVADVEKILGIKSKIYDELIVFSVDDITVTEDDAIEITSLIKDKIVE